MGGLFGGGSKKSSSQSNIDPSEPAVSTTTADKIEVPGRGTIWENPKLTAKKRASANKSLVEQSFGSDDANSFSYG